jgi:hypothetical protein
MERGARVRCEMTKWRGRPHWSFSGSYLGSDDHGDWVGFPAGTSFTRPGARFEAVNDQVTLVPAEVGGRRPGWVATFHGPGGYLPVGGHQVPIDLYVDMTTPPAWDGDVLRAVDLDLDVVRGRSGRVWVDDEDEFAAHRRDYGYPSDVVELALASCAAVSAAARDREPPFDGPTHTPWLGLVAQ